MATSETSEADSWCNSHLKIILLGGRNSGKSSVGNLLLGKDEFLTKERTICSRRVGMVAGQWLTVVDTPGWWCDFSTQDTCELVKRELVNSVSLCSPGPHVFLIIVKLSSAFSERRRRAVEEHVALLGDGVWGHSILVLTGTDRFKHSEEEQVLIAGKALHWLRERCNHRTHRFNLSVGTDVSKLLEKIQRIVRENGHGVFEVQGNILQEAAEETRRVEERAQQRLMRVRRHRCLMQERVRAVSDIRLMLLGAKGSGKTSVMNTILSRETQPTKKTIQCVTGKAMVFGRDVTVVDTPGWWMNYFCEESSIFDQREMVLSLSLCPPGPHVFLLVIRADRAFTETYRRAAQDHLELISEHIWSRVILVFSVGDWLEGTSLEQYIESEGEPLQWLVERCGNRYHVLNCRARGDGFQVRELIRKIELLFTGGSGYQYYEIERSVVEQLDMKMREESEGAKERLRMKEKQRQMAKSQLEKLGPLQELRLVLIGGRKTGKSSCGNTILGRECFNTDTHTASCAVIQHKIKDKVVTVVDTPGGSSVSPNLVTEPPTCAVLLVVNLSSSFKNTQKEELEEQLEEGGGHLWHKAVVLFSYGDWLGDTSIEQRIESEGEPLQRLVEKCGNRYQVLDNRNTENGDQVDDLIQLIEEMTTDERVEALHRTDHMWSSVPATHEQEEDAVTQFKQDFNTSCDLPDLDFSTQAIQKCLDATGAACQLVPLPASRMRAQNGVTVLDRDTFMSIMASVLFEKKSLRSAATGHERTTVNLPVYVPAELFNNNLRLNGEGQVSLYSASHQPPLVVLPQSQNIVVVDESAANVRQLCHPVLIERTLRRLTESGGLQQLIEQWGDSSLEELEAFIDAYFEMVWEQTMGSCQLTEPKSPTTEQDTEVTEAGQDVEVLSSIDRKLSKLELLEEIRNDLFKMKESLEQSCKAIQELTHKS